MTHRAPGRRQPRIPLRPPRYGTGPIFLASPPSAHARRALRLLVTAGCYTAGLCLVIALVALVAAMTAPGHASGVAADDRLAAGPPAASSLTSAGDGGFRTVVSSPWRLGWSYRGCPAGGGHLIVLQAMPGAAARTRLDQAGESGRGATRWYRGDGPLRFRVHSDCTWTMRVQQRS